MVDWLSALEWFDKIFWIIALIGSVFFLIMLVSTFMGGGMDVDVDMEMDGDFDVDTGGFHFFTIKNLIAFFTIFGWTGIACLDADLGKASTVLISFLAGLLMMLVMATLFFLMNKLNDSGTLVVKNAIGAVGEVYMTVGAERSTIGKVNVRIQGALRELEALTDEQIDLTQGAVVEVQDVTTNGILIVGKLQKSK
jgi:amino acid transporter